MVRLPKRLDFGVETLLGSKSEILRSSDLITEYIVEHGSIDRLLEHLDAPSLESAETVISAWDGQKWTARAWSPAVGPSYELFPTKEQLPILYNAGCTIVLEDVERFIPTLRVLCRSLERDLGLKAGQVNVEVFCSKGVGRGRPHFDSSYTFNCQIAGTKHWRVAKNRSIAFPPSGMFLGRVPQPEIFALLSEPLPISIEEGLSFTAEPGTVVFLPPGVLHETNSENGSYAIAFAIEDADSLCGLITKRVTMELQKVPELRAKRLGSQLRDVGHDTWTLAVQILQSISNDLQAGRFTRYSTQYIIKPGLSVERHRDGAIILRGGSSSKVLSVDTVTESILVWASQRSCFTRQDVLCELSTLDPDAVRDCLYLLTQRGLLQEARATN